MDKIEVVLKHAEIEEIRNVVRALEDSRIFESCEVIVVINVTGIIEPKYNHVATIDKCCTTWH